MSWAHWASTKRPPKEEVCVLPNRHRGKVSGGVDKWEIQSLRLYSFHVGGIWRTRPARLSVLFCRRWQRRKKSHVSSWVSVKCQSEKKVQEGTCAKLVCSFTLEHSSYLHDHKSCLLVPKISGLRIYWEFLRIADSTSPSLMTSTLPLSLFLTRQN